MIPLKIVHEGETLSGLLPEAWGEVTVSGWVALQTAKTDSEILGALSGIDPLKIDNTNADLSPAFEKLYEYLNERPEGFDDIVSQVIELEGKRVDFPKSLEFTRFGQNSMLKNLIRANADDLEKIIPEVFAIYCQPLIDGDFTRERVPYFTKIINNLPITEVRPHVLFFLNRLRRLKINLLIG
jgi:hypothetical protein